VKESCIVVAGDRGELTLVELATVVVIVIMVPVSVAIAVFL